MSSFVEPKGWILFNRSTYHQTILINYYIYDTIYIFHLMLLTSIRAIQLLIYLFDD